MKVIKVNKIICRDFDEQDNVTSDIIFTQFVLFGLVVYHKKAYFNSTHILKNNFGFNKK